MALPKSWTPYSRRAGCAAPRGQYIVVEVVVLAVAIIEQVLEGCNDVTVHDVNLVTPKEMGVEGTPDMVAVLGGRVFLHMLPHTKGREQGMEDGPNLL
jgi:hypothetical protein